MNLHTFIILYNGITNNLKLFLLVAFYANVILCTNNMKHKKYHTVGTIPKLNIKIVENDKIDTSNTQIHDCSLPWIGTLIQIYK